MIGYLEILDENGNAVRLHGSGTTDRAVTGLAGLPGMDSAGGRAAITVRPGNHGSINRTRFFKDQILTIEGYVKGTTRDLVNAQRDILVAAIMDCLDTPRLLRWQRGDTGAELQTYVKWDDGGLTVVPEAGEHLLRYQAHFHLPDPRAFTQSAVNQDSGTLGASTGGLLIPIEFPFTFNLGSAGLATATGGGLVPTPATFRIHGAVTNPTILLVATQQKIVLTGTVNAGDYIDVDTDAHEVTSSFGEPVNSYVDWAETEWFDMPPSGGQVRLIADSGDSTAYMTVTYSPAYV